MPNKITVLLMALVMGWALSAEPSAHQTRGMQMGVFMEGWDRPAAAPAVKSLGLGWIRVMYDWPWLEPSRGQIDWASFDRGMARAKAQNLKVLVVVQGSPAWANGGRGDNEKTPPLPEFYGQFANYVAEMVRHGADAVEIWNEPNSAFWLPAPDPKTWAKLVVASYDAVKAVNPKTPVITGGVCPVDQGSLSSNSPANFLQAALEAVPEFGRKFDGVGHHPYVFADDPAAKDPLTAPYQYNAIWQTREMQKVLAKYGDGDKPFWFTEYGVPTGGPFGAVPPERSGEIYQHYFDAFDQLAAGGIKLGPMFFWTLKDSPHYRKANMMEGWEGVFDADDRPKPSVEVIRARAAQTVN
jgi:hypothetical protein